MQTQGQDISPGRDKDGKFAHGNNIGAVGAETDAQRFRRRVRSLWENKTTAEIEKLVKNKRAWNKLPAIDGAIIQRIAQAQSITGIQDMSLLLDRLCGKATQPISGEDGAPLIPQVDLMEIARRTAFMLAMAGNIAAQPQPALIEQKPESPHTNVPPTSE